MSKRDPSYPPIDGQLDVFEVLELIDEEGLVPGKHEHPSEDIPEPITGLTRAEFMGKNERDDGLHVARAPDYSFWVLDENDERLHDVPFWSQIECWAFIVGYRIALSARA